METTHPYFYLCVLYVHMCVYSSASGRIIGAKDYASIQINIADVSVKKKKKKRWESVSLSLYVQRQVF